MPAKTRLLGLFFVLGLALGTTACVRSGGGDRDGLADSGTRPGGDAEGFHGLVTMNNARPRCGFRQLAPSQFETTCSAVVIDDAGNERLALGVAEGVSLHWPDPTRLMGAQLTELQCQESAEGITQVCQVSLSSAEVTRLAFFLEAKENSSGRSESFPTTVALVSAASFGVVPHLLGFQTPSAAGTVSPKDPMGHQTLGLDPTEHLIGRPYSVCAWKDRVYIGMVDYVFAVESGKLRVYAGSPNRKNTNELSHRLRVALGGSRVRSSTGLSLACAPEGLYVADSNNHRILLVKDSGPVVQIAANGQTAIHQPKFIARASDGTLFFVETPFRLRKIDPVTSVVSSISLTGVAPSEVSGMAIAPGVIFLSEEEAHKVHRVDLSSSTIALFAGSGTGGRAGDGGPALLAELHKPRGLAIDKSGSLLIADKKNGRVRRVFEHEGGYRIETIAGPGTLDGERTVDVEDNCVENASASVKAKDLTLCGPVGLGLDEGGNLYIVDRAAHLIYKVDASATATTFAGAHPKTLKASTEKLLGSASFAPSLGVAWTKEGTIFISEQPYKRVRQVDLVQQKVTHFVGWKQTPLREIGDLRLLSDGSLLIAHKDGITRVFPDQTFTKFAAGEEGVEVEGSLAADFKLSGPTGFATHSNGTIFVAQDNAIYTVNPESNRVFRLAGARGEEGYAGDGQDAKLAKFRRPSGMDVGKDNSLFLADSLNHRIRRIDLVTGVITTVAGTGVAGAALEGAWADETPLSNPSSLRVVSNGQIYVTDTENNSIRILQPVTLAEGRVRYRITSLVGGTSSDKDCSGTVLKKLEGPSTENEIKASLDVLCQGFPIAIDVKDTCSQAGGEIRIVYTQAFGNFSVRTPSFTSANLVSVIRPCE